MSASMREELSETYARGAGVGDGGPAFPIYQEDMNLGTDAGPGMSLRDYFAIHVDVSAYDFGGIEDAAEWMGEEAPDEDDTNEMFAFSFRLVARLRYQLADAMLEAREES